MLKLQTALLVAALAAPFGFALHDDLSRGEPQLGWYTTYEGPADEAATAAAVREILARAEGERARATHADATSMSMDAIGQMLGAEPASMGPALAGLRLGMTASELASSAPEATRWSGRSDELGKASLALEHTDAAELRLAAVRVELPDAGGHARALGQERWGEPQIAGEGGLAIWINESTGMRAALTAQGGRSAIELSRVMTLEQLVAAPGSGKVFGFETGPRLLGATVEQLERAYPDILLDRLYREHATLDIPGIALDPSARPLTRVVITLRNDKVTEVRLGFACGASCGQVVSALERALGTPARADETSGAHVIGASPRVTVRMDPNHVVEIQAALR